jgi:large subunit ribosomal protein LP2
LWLQRSLCSSVGIEADAEKLALVVKELKGKNLEEVIAAGKDKLGSMPAGGGSHE